MNSRNERRPFDIAKINVIMSPSKFLKGSIVAYINPERNGAFVILEDDEGKIALVLHNYGGRKWSLPGGGVGLAELASKAVVRETFEETGFVATSAIILPIAILSPQLRYGLDLLFLCERTASKLTHDPGVINEEEISDMKFMSMSEVVELGDQIYPAQRRMILEHYVAYKKTGKVVMAQL